MSDVEIVVRGRHVDVSSRFKEQAQSKLGRADRFGVPISRIDVELSKESNPRLADRAFAVQLTCRGTGPIIRAEAYAADQYSSLDMAFDRLEQQLRRAHDRSRFHRTARTAKRIDLPAELGADLLVEEQEPVAQVSETEVAVDDELFAAGPVVERDKTHPTTPMTIEQAVTEMELVGHDFFLFHEVESAAPAVVYRRRGYDYGLIRIDTAANSTGD